MKKTLHKIHLWLSIPLGLIITVICFTGATLVFEQDITRALNKHLYQAEIPQGKERLSPSEVINIVQDRHDGMEISSVSIPKAADATYQISFSNGGKKVLFVNPYTGESIGWSKSYPFFQTMRKLHRWFLDIPKSKGSMSVGKLIVGVSTIAMTVILISGLVIWIPRTRKALKNRLTVACGKGVRRLMYDSHVALGFYATIFLLLMALTGPTWSFGWYREAAYTLLGAEPQTSNQQSGHSHGHTDKKESSNTERKQDNTIAYDVVLKEIQDIYTDYNYIKLSKNEATVSLNKFGYKYKSDKVKFNPKTGVITSVKKFEENTVRQNLRWLIYSLHVGTWGGPVTKILYFLAALIGATLPLTGYYLWMKKKKII
ncbi:PepSY domain-containing protein [uncultured Bacteroides sp.]|uniref:PepSY-associated TM helix domain-containing protein n=1 Tax=uncultured Bacteroides sp. TaxID=162156 RepID=UPI0025FDEFE0|nr:PepSY-associated TM helix domain-containing protein [uncultured Bacteroides sp.]